MSSGLYSGQPGLSLGTGLYRTVSGLWSGASGLAMAFGGAGMPLSLNFLTMTAYTLDPRITFSRGSQAMVTDATGKLTYAPNNLLTNSQDFEAAAWAKSAAGTGSVPVVTANAAIAPDGTTTADQVVFALNGGTTSSDWSWITQGYTAVAGGTYIISLWARTISGTAKIIVDNTSQDTNLADITTTWARVSFVRTDAAGGVRTVRIGLRGNNVASGQSGSATVLFWGAQLEAVTYQTTPSPYVSTTPKNLLGYTQEFDNAAWTKSNATAYPFDPATATQGPELVTNGDFGNGLTGWTAGNSASLAVSSGELIVTNTTAAFGLASQPITTVIGATYIVTCNARVITGTVAALQVANTATGPQIADVGTPSTTTQALSLIFKATATTTFVRGVIANVNGNSSAFDNISVKELSGGLITAPDGSLTADKLVEDTVNSTHRAFQLVALPSTKTAFSVYAKAAERSWLCLVDATIANGFAFFNLADGVLGTIGANATAEITPVGGGWYRCSIVVTLAGGGDSFNIRIATANGTTTYTGDGTSGIYIWGAQLSNSASVDPYVYNPVAAPSSTAYYGPRFDYDPVTLAPKGLLIEEQRTNLLLRSEEFDNASWLKSRSTITANATTSPDGTVDADKLVEDTTATATHRVFQQAPKSASSVTRTFSVYLKAAERTFARVSISDNTEAVTARVDVDLSAGTINTAAVFGGTSISSPSASISLVGNGWYRISITATFDATITNPGAFVFLCSTFGVISYTGNGTSGIFVWGAQWEDGSFATSYIPTVASTVTRSADVALMQGANFSQWCNQNEGTFVAVGDVLATAPTTFLFDMRAGTGNTNETGLYQVGTAPVFVVASGGVSSAVLVPSGAVTANTPYALAGAYRVNDFAASFNGGTVVTDASGAVPVGLDRAWIGSAAGSASFANGHIRSIRYYNTRLPNAQLQALTS